MYTFSQMIRSLGCQSKMYQLRRAVKNQPLQLFRLIDRQVGSTWHNSCFNIISKLSELTELTTSP